MIIKYTLYLIKIKLLSIMLWQIYELILFTKYSAKYDAKRRGGGCIEFHTSTA
jgi:hypothetical protein